MSNQIDREISKKIFLRMHDDGVSMTTILSVLAEANPEASDEEVVLFMAECLNDPPAKKKRKPSKLTLPKPFILDSSSGSCSGSSNDRCC